MAKTPVDDDRLNLTALLAETSLRLARALNGELEVACGLPLPWYDVLVRVDRAPDGFLTMTQLATEVLLTSGGITRLVDRIAEAGFVERQNCPNDRRSVHVALTASGKEILNRATAVHLGGVERHFTGLLSDKEQASLASVLRRVLDAKGC